jgi:hypothetical protein
LQKIDHHHKAVDFSVQTGISKIVGAIELFLGEREIQ